MLFDALGNYTLAWEVGVGLGLVAGMVQMGYAFKGQRPRPPMAVAT